MHRVWCFQCNMIKLRMSFWRGVPAGLLEIYSILKIQTPLNFVLQIFKVLKWREELLWEGGGRWLELCLAGISIIILRQFCFVFLMAYVVAPQLELPYKVILMMELQHTFSWKNKIKLFLNYHQNSWYSRAQVDFKF